MSKTLFVIAFGVLAFTVGAGLVYKKFFSRTPEQIARAEQQQSLARRMIAGQFTDPVSGNVLPWRLFVPEGVDAQHPAPIILALHSGAGRGNDNLKQLDDTIAYLLSDELQGIAKTIVLAPQAAERSHWVDYPTFDPPFTNFSQQQIPESQNIKSAIRLLKETIAHYHADPTRVYITGISMGGEGSWDAITYYPDLFAAALILNGAGDPAAMVRVKDLPIRFFHGSDDSITPTANSRELAAALKELGALARYEEIPGAGHNIRHRVYNRENLGWLLQHSNPR